MRRFFLALVFIPLPLLAGCGRSFDCRCDDGRTLRWRDDGVTMSNVGDLFEACAAFCAVPAKGA